MKRMDGYWPIVILAVVLLVLKLFFSYNVYGTNDIASSHDLADILLKIGSFDIYRHDPNYNHSPLTSWYYMSAEIIALKTGLAFPFVFRLFTIFADLASVFVIWHMLKGRTKDYKIVAAICCINPVNFLISSYHGNADTIMVFFILVAIYFALSGRIALSGLIFGLSVCVKIVPLILVPAFLFSLPDRKRRSLFILFSMILPLAVFLPYLVHDAPGMIRSIFFYTSQKGNWGLGCILKWCYRYGIPGGSLIVLGWIIAKQVIWGMLIFVASLLFLLSRPFLRKISLLDGVFMTFCLFFILTPGFGLQYLSWISYFAVIFSPVLGIIFLGLGELFLVRVYGYWGGWSPPYYADSRGLLLWPWVGFEAVLGLILWGYTLFMLIKILTDKHRLFRGSNP
jgi:uncharacterized membrane protein